MQCSKCKDTIVSGEEREHFGTVLCEDCYIDAISPARTCDPWAVHSAKNTIERSGVQLSECQQKILGLLREKGEVAPETVCRELDIAPDILEREVAALRHMEKIKGGLREGKKVLMLW